jgi:hypothetical protein
LIDLTGRKECLERGDAFEGIIRSDEKMGKGSEGELTVRVIAGDNNESVVVITRSRV